MSPYRVADCDDVVEKRQSLRAKALDRARKNVSFRKKWGRAIVVFYGALAFAFVLILMQGLERFFEAVISTNVIPLETSILISFAAVCGMFGFKFGFYAQLAAEQAFGGVADEMLVDYHDKLDAAGLLEAKEAR